MDLVFARKDNEPMKFKLRPCPERERVGRMIDQGGGVLLENGSDGDSCGSRDGFGGGVSSGKGTVDGEVIHLVPRGAVASKPQSVAVQFIIESDAKKARLNIADFFLNPREYVSSTDVDADLTRVVWKEAEDDLIDRIDELDDGGKAKMRKSSKSPLSRVEDTNPSTNGVADDARRGERMSFHRDDDRVDDDVDDHPDDDDDLIDIDVVNYTQKPPTEKVLPSNESQTFHSLDGDDDENDGGNSAVFKDSVLTERENSEEKGTFRVVKESTPTPLSIAKDDDRHDRDGAAMMPKSTTFKNASRVDDDDNEDGEESGGRGTTESVVDADRIYTTAENDVVDAAPLDPIDQRLFDGNDDGTDMKNTTAEEEVNTRKPKQVVKQAMTLEEVAEELSAFYRVSPEVTWKALKDAGFSVKGAICRIVKGKAVSSIVHCNAKESGAFG